MTAKIYKFPDLMPKKQNTIQALVDEIIAEILSSPTLHDLDNRLMQAHNGRPFHYDIGYEDAEIGISISLKFSPEK